MGITFPFGLIIYVCRGKRDYEEIVCHFILVAWNSQKHLLDFNMKLENWLNYYSKILKWNFVVWTWTSQKIRPKGIVDGLWWHGDASRGFGYWKSLLDSMVRAYDNFQMSIGLKCIVSFTLSIASETSTNYFSICIYGCMHACICVCIS